METERKISATKNSIKTAQDAILKIEQYQQLISGLSTKKSRLLKLQGWLRLIPHLLIERILPAVQEEANEALTRLTNTRVDGPLVLKFPRPGDPDYLGGKRERLDIFALDAVGSRRVEVLSGGEKGWVSLALRLALSKVALGRSGARIDLIALDEPFTNLDEEGMSQVPSKINELSEFGHQVILISHIKEIQDAAQQRLRLERVPGAGTIVVEGA